MARCIAWLFTFHGVLSALWCLTLDPYPTVNVTRYNNQSFTCSVDLTWSTVSYFYGDESIAFFLVVDGKCKDMAIHTKGLYTTNCDDSTRTFYLTINNVTDRYKGKYIKCQVAYSAGTSRDKQSLINIQYQPTTSPTITQTPVGPIIEDNKVILTCTIQGGNPVATITWSCDGATQITPTGSSSTIAAISSIELVTSKNNNGEKCTCTGIHLLWTSDKTQQHTITVYYKPTSTPSIIQTPPGPINESSTVILTCEIKGGNPLATITWTCVESSPINPTGSPSTNTTTSSVQWTVNSNDNGGICTCIGHHPVWKTDKTTDHTLNVTYQPTTSPTITQAPDRPIIEGNNVTLTCTIQGGNPVATITWSCDGATQITPTGSPSTVDAISSVELVTSKNNNGQICTCIGRHLLWTDDKTQQHTITVYYEPTSTPSIIQTPPGPLNENTTVILACDINGGNPLATITWTCDGSSPINPTRSPPTNTTTSSVQFTVNSTANGRICTCIGHHPVWTTDKTTGHTLDVRYQPTASPTITQTPVGPIIEGNKVTLTCTIQGGNPVATITQSCVGATQITRTGSPSTVDAISSVELVTSKNNNGQICTCTGRHLLWTNNKTQQHNITVYYSPTVDITNMNPIDVIENVTLQLACQVLDGNPTNNSFSWYKGNSTTPLGMQSNFSISNVSRTNSGEYRCEGSNGIGQNGVDTIYVNVLYNPEITHLSVNDGKEIVENDTAIIRCNVESKPLSKLEWTFKNKTLNQGNHGVQQSNYTIQKAKCVDTGFYMCTATNFINMNSYSDKRVVQLSVKCSPRRDTMFELPENQIGVALGQHLKMQIHIIAYPAPVVEWRFRSADNYTKTLSSNCNQTNMFKHTACFEKDNVTEDDFGNYSIFVHNGLGNNFSYLFNVDPQGPPDMSSNVNTSCKVLSADILWTTGFHGGKQQQFYVLVLDVKTRITKIYNTHQFGNEKNDDKSYNIALQPGLYSFRIFGNNSFGHATSGESSCQVNDKASESNSVIAVAAGTGSAAAALIIGVVVVIVVLRKRMANPKGNENSGKERLNMTPMDEDEVVEGLQENDCYASAGPHFRPKDTGAANYEVVERKGQSNTKDVKQDSQETALYSIVDKKSSAKGKTTSGEKTKDGPDQNEDVYENFTNQGSSDNQKQNVNKDGLRYSELVFNPLPNGSKFIIHGIEDKTIYAKVDTTQKIDPLPESDDEVKGNEA